MFNLFSIYYEPSFTLLLLLLLILLILIVVVVEKELVGYF